MCSVKQTERCPMAAHDNLEPCKKCPQPWGKYLWDYKSGSCWLNPKFKPSLIGEIKMCVHDYAHDTESTKTELIESVKEILSRYEAKESLAEIFGSQCVESKFIPKGIVIIGTGEKAIGGIDWGKPDFNKTVIVKNNEQEDKNV